MMKWKSRYQIINGCETSLVSILSANSRAGHTLATVFGSMVVMEHHGVTDDGSLSSQGKVGVCEEASGGGKEMAEKGSNELKARLKSLTLPHSGDRLNMVSNTALPSGYTFNLRSL